MQFVNRLQNAMARDASSGSAQKIGKRLPNAEGLRIRQNDASQQRGDPAYDGR
jgi:hypothetical protein